MSQRVCEYVHGVLADRGEVSYDELVDDVMERADVKKASARTYVRRYCEVEERVSGEKVVVAPDPEYTSSESSRSAQQTVDAAATTAEVPQESGGREASTTSTIHVGGLDEPCPPRTGEEWNGMPVYEESDHPLVPDVSTYLERRLDPDADDDRATTKDIEAFGVAKEAEDYGVLLIGPPGVGKGVLARYAAANQNKPLVRFTFGARTSKEKLIGGFVPKNGSGDDEAILDRAREMAEREPSLTVANALEVIGQRHRYKWQDGLLTKAVRNGWDFLGDEVNAVRDPSALVALNGLLEDSSNRSLELDEKGEVIDPHPDFRFIGTMNPKEFTGANEMPESLEGRMIPIYIDHLDEQREKTLLQGQTDLSDTEASKLVQFAQNLRDEDVQCSFRELDKIAEMASIMSLEAAAKTILLPMAQTGNDRDTIERAIEMKIGL